MANQQLEGRAGILRKMKAIRKSIMENIQEYNFYMQPSKYPIREFIAECFKKKIEEQKQLYNKLKQQL